MTKRKLPAGLVIAFATLAAAGIFVNGSQALRSVGFIAGGAKANALYGEKLSPLDIEDQRKAMDKLRPARKTSTTPSSPDRPALLIEPELGNIRQTPNISQPVSYWWGEDSYTKRVQDDLEVQRGLVDRAQQSAGGCGTGEIWWIEDSYVEKLRKKVEGK
jgi:hypothetical protein